jgi:alpha-tubulin suppressor-like RCC1 family protein
VEPRPTTSQERE